jgi:predicted enzyme related to lactoylglutathione lyase
MLTQQKLIAFVATRDPMRARKFYGEALGLTMVSDDPYALVFDAAGTTIRIQKVEHLAAQPFTVLGWQVSNLDEIVRELARREVAMERFEGMDQDALGIWTSPSAARVAWFKDPDGNTLSLTQL